jgi:small subunit ribosomal protein S9
MEVINAIGRRKSAIARIYLSEGKGTILVNKKDFKAMLGQLQRKTRLGKIKANLVFDKK